MDATNLTSASTTAAPQSAFIVYSDVDGRRFKMVIKGHLSRLPVSKIKRYLENSTKVPCEQQILTCNGRLLADDMIGDDFDLTPETVLHLSYSTVRTVAGTETHVPGLKPDVAGRQRQQHQQNYHHNPTDLSTTSSSAQQQHQQQQSYGSPSSNNRQQYGGGVSSVSSSAAAHSGAAVRRSDGYPVSPSATHYANDANSSTSQHATHGGWQPSRTAPTLGNQQQQSDRSSNNNYRSGGNGVPPNPFEPPVPIQTPKQIGGSAHPMQAKVTQLEDENRMLRDELERMRKREEHASHLQPPQALSVMASARANLVELGKEIGMHLSFDDNLTCVVGADEKSTIILTVDPATERLYLYSTLLTVLPSEPAARLRLFETLLEWSMLGRDIAGGGIGICNRSGLVMLSASVDLKNSNQFGLRDLAPVFVECLVRYRNELTGMMVGGSGGGAAADEERSHDSYHQQQPRRAPPSPPRR